MGIQDKMQNAADKVTGKAKEVAGDAGDNERLQAEGRGQQSQADMKQAGENLKDAVRDN
ncbi:CsbD family protein [Kytococcus sedentarius]|uniref:CsbD family protein n=1 Tax=Kytococcus sedentarius TaxID=1276 RepID=UPI0035BC8A8B